MVALFVSFVTSLGARWAATPLKVPNWSKVRERWGGARWEVLSTVVEGDRVKTLLDHALEAGGGLLRLTPTWVPRSFLHPGRRLKLFPGDLYAYGAERGGIDER